MIAECTTWGATVEEFDDFFASLVHRLKRSNNVSIETYVDHQITMTFALAACGTTRTRLVSCRRVETSCHPLFYIGKALVV